MPVVLLSSSSCSVGFLVIYVFALVTNPIIISFLIPSFPGGFFFSDFFFRHCLLHLFHFKICHHVLFCCYLCVMKICLFFFGCFFLFCCDIKVVCTSIVFFQCICSFSPCKLGFLMFNCYLLVIGSFIIHGLYQFPYFVSISTFIFFPFLFNNLLL